MKKKIIVDGKEVKLNSMEESIASGLDAQLKATPAFQELQNAQGFEFDITTLTTMLKSVSEQKFFELSPADYLPVKVGEGAWSQQLTKYTSFTTGGDFETGLVDMGSNNARLAMASAGVEPINYKVNNWAKGIQWNIMELGLATKAGNWDIVTAKEKARKKNWDLGIQRIAFLGMADDAEANGLLTQPNVTSNTTRITKYLSAMTATEFQAFLAGVIGDYRANCEFTAYPDLFIIPEQDYTGLKSVVDETFPMATRLKRLEEAMSFGDKKIQVKPCAYADQVNNGDYIDLNRYVLTTYDEDSMRMDIPVDYTSTMQNTLNGFSFDNVAYGQFTGVQSFRPKETLYFDWSV